jgi:hypothetical protein
VSENGGPYVTAYDHIYPVVGGSVPSDLMQANAVAIDEVCGTAFPIGENLFLTCEHVLRSAATHGWQGLGYLANTDVRVAKFEEIELFEQIDIALCRATVPARHFLSWSRELEAMLRDVQVCGYPYALDSRGMTLRVRAFRGPIVCCRIGHELKAKPLIYELPFLCPRGLSGAPLWSVGLPAKVLGVVFGNAITEMEVYRETETLKEGAETTTLLKTEALHLGLAVPVQAILPIRSGLLGTTLGEYLETQGLLAAPSKGA